MKSIKKYIVRKSSIQGKGVFAFRDIEKGEHICTLRGKRTSMKALERMYRNGNTRAGCDPFQIEAYGYISLANPYNYINHSCGPNAAVKGTNELIAIKQIKKGDEIAYDYSATEWTPQEYPPYYGEEWPLKCHCGSASCRKLATCFYYLPKSVQEKYIRSGVIQDHIIEQLTWPKSEQRCYVCEEKLKEARTSKKELSARAKKK